MATKWTHDTTVTVTFPGTDPEERESEDFDVRLYVSGSPATDDYFDRSFGNWLPGDPAEIELISFEICETHTCPPCKGSGWQILPAGAKCTKCRGIGKVYTYRKPIEARYPDTNDQGVIDAVDAWFADNGDECWQSLEEECVE